MPDEDGNGFNWTFRYTQAAVDALCPRAVYVEVRWMDSIESQNMSVAERSCESAVLRKINYCGSEMGESPKLILNLVTLSEGVQKAFGGAVAGVFSNSMVLRKEMERVKEQGKR